MELYTVGENKLIFKNGSDVRGLQVENKWLWRSLQNKPLRRNGGDWGNLWSLLNVEQTLEFGVIAGKVKCTLLGRQHFAFKLMQQLQRKEKKIITLTLH